MWKKTVATAGLLAGLLLFILELAVLKLDGLSGFLMAAGGAVLFLEGAVALCVLNSRKQGIAEAVDVGCSIVEVLLDIFFDR